jgi:hypothetical protein
MFEVFLRMMTPLMMKRREMLRFPMANGLSSRLPFFRYARQALVLMLVP